ncbi:MAG: filamentous hemagglutinin N-terminal domain-containing protein [Cyanobacteria bacterium P01_F01_bin.150]
MTTLIAMATYTVINVDHSAFAQVTPDGTLSTVVTTTDNLNFVIENGERTSNHLFHSFDEFSIPTNGSAVFNNAIDLDTIFSRVTGSNVSDIDGLIQANGTTNVFLLNPNGIIFGPNASLNIGGSFLATTADRVLFENDQFFSATDTDTAPLLTISSPIGLQFGSTPSSIMVQGKGHNLVLDIDTLTPIRDNRPVGLQVDSGHTLGLVGGDIVVEGGNLTANQGRIELGSVKQSGSVMLTPTPNGFSFDYTDIQNFGDLRFTQASSVDVSGEGSGNLHVQAGTMSVLEESAIISNILGANDGREVLIRASDSVEIIGTETGEFPSGLFNQTEVGTTGSGGEVSIETDTLLVANNALIASTLSGSGNGGDLNIAANDINLVGGTVPFYSSGVLNQVSSLGAGGQGGNINIAAQNLQITNGAAISSATAGDSDGGIITLTIDKILSVDGEGLFSFSRIGSEVGGTDVNGTVFAGTGNGGEIKITAQNLQVTNGAAISGTTVGDGDGANIILAVGETLVVDGQGTFSLSGIGSDVGTINGNGNVVSGEGNGGEIIIAAQDLQITNGGIISGSTIGDGNGANITLTIDETLVIDGDGTIGSEVGGIDFNGNVVSGEGNGGEITITAQNLQVTNGGAISGTTAGNGDGANITLTVDETLVIDGQNNFSLSGIGSEVGTVDNNGNVIRGKGNGGEINITAQSLQITNGGVISGTTAGEGKGANIQLTIADTLIIDGQGSFAASGISSQVDDRGFISGGDLGGNITVTAQNLQITNGGAISGSTGGNGNAGSIDLTVANTLMIDREGPFGASSINSQVGGIDFNGNVISGAGNGGEIVITARNVQITNGGAISGATIGEGNAGNINLMVTETLSIDGEGRFASVIDSQAGGIDADGNFIRGDGNGGDITLTARNVQITNGGAIAGSTGGKGDAGNLTLTARETIEVSTSIINSDVFQGATGNGGDITIATNQLLLRAGGQIDTSTAGDGVAGSININANDLRLTGISAILENGTQIPSRIISASATDFAAGSIQIMGDRLTLQDGADISVSSLGSGDSGNLIINMDTIQLDNGSRLSADVNGGSQGNINVMANDLLVLRRGSSVSATATGASTGGNIEIRSPFIIGRKRENSDIVANAVQGNGGNILITTQGLFGLEFRDRLTPSSDITASSEFGLSGTVEITSPDVDPNSQILGLSETLVDISQLIRSGCSLDQDQFLLAGRGGLPDSPLEVIDGDRPWFDLRNPFIQSHDDLAIPLSAEQPMPFEPLQEATGMAIAPDGTFQLTASYSQHPITSQPTCTSAPKIS